MVLTVRVAKRRLAIGVKNRQSHYQLGKAERSLKARGFSLLELMVVIVLLGGLLALVIPAIRAIGGFDVRGEIVKIAGLSNEVYALAAIAGKTHRIVFDFDENKYWVEEKVGDAGEITPELGYEDLLKERQTQGKDKDDDAVKAFLPSYKEVEGHLKEKIELPTGIVLYGAWTETMSDVARGGQVAIYFFSGGYTQASFVSLAAKDDEEDTAVYFSMDPLTAEITINQGEPDIKELTSTQSEK